MQQWPEMAILTSKPFLDLYFEVGFLVDQWLKLVSIRCPTFKTKFCEAIVTFVFT